MAVLSAGCGRAPEAAGTVLTSVGAVRHLAASQAALGLPVHLTGVLTYFDGISSYCYVQDASGGIRVNLAPGQAVPNPGFRVEVTGSVFSAGVAPAIADGRISPIKAEDLPQAVPLTAGRLREQSI